MKLTWLAVAALCTGFSIGEHALALAVWLAPIFLLRFTRTSGALAGYLTAIPALAVATFLRSWGVSPVPLGLVVLSAFLAPIVQLLPYLADRLIVGRLRGLPATLFFPCAVISVEWLTSLLFGSGSSVAYSFRHDLSLLQLASVTGIWGLAFLPHWAAAVVNTAWEKDFRWRDAGVPVGALAATLVLIHGFGNVRLAFSGRAETSIRVAGVVPSPEHREAVRELVVPLLTGSDPSIAERFRELGRELADELFAATEREARAGARLVAWSEAALPVLAGDEAEVLERARRLAAELGVFLAVTPAVADARFAELRDAGEPFVRNKLILVTDRGDVAWEYLKARPVPMMEAGYTVAGDGRIRTVETPLGATGGVVCYDLDFPTLIRRAGRAGVALMIAPSNDWPQIVDYHSHVARVRAVENGFSLLRPTSDGLSIAIDPYGRQLGAVDFFRSGGASLVAALPAGRVATVYSRVGDAVVYLCLGGALFLAMAARRRRG